MQVPFKKMQGTDFDNNSRANNSELHLTGIIDPMFKISFTF